MSDRPPPRNEFEAWLRRFENPSVTTIMVVIGLIPIVALIALIVVAWLFG
ncbi:MAG: hypothetical protein AAGH92_12715 [Planctomycetota bacterium]